MSLPRIISFYCFIFHSSYALLSLSASAILISKHSDIFQDLQMNAMVANHDRIYYRNVFYDGKKVDRKKIRALRHLFFNVYSREAVRWRRIDEMKILKGHRLFLPPFFPLFLFFTSYELNQNLGTKFMVMLVPRRLI